MKPLEEVVAEIIARARELDDLIPDDGPPEASPKGLTYDAMRRCWRDDQVKEWVSNGGKPAFITQDELQKAIGKAKGEPGYTKTVEEFWANWLLEDPPKGTTYDEMQKAAYGGVFTDWAGLSEGHEPYPPAYDPYMKVIELSKRKELIMGGWIALPEPEATLRIVELQLRAKAEPWGTSYWKDTEELLVEGSLRSVWNPKLVLVFCAGEFLVKDQWLEA